MHTFFTSQNKVDTSRHRICLRWRYVPVLPFAFLTALSSSKFLAGAAIIAQCRTREQLQSEGTSEGHLVQPPAPSRAKCSIRADKVWKSPARKTAAPLWSLLLALATLLLPGAFLSLRPTGISLAEIVTVLFCLQAATWGRPYLLCNYPISSWMLQLEPQLAIASRAK